MFAFIKLYEILDWNENKVDINLLIRQFVLRYFTFAGIVTNRNIKRRT